jgi:hypothetical protein
VSRQKFLANQEKGQLERHINELRAELRNADPEILARLTASRYEADHDSKGTIDLPVWGQQTSVSVPEYLAIDGHTGEPAPILTQALLVYYFSTADGSPLAGRWISFSELPEGRFYNQAFQGYTGHEIRRAYGDDIDGLAVAAEALPTALQPHRDLKVGNRCFSFQALPRVPLLLVYWQGDEDFQSSYQILFDAAVVHYLPTDVCAILGSSLTRMLVKPRRQTGGE